MYYTGTFSKYLLFHHFRTVGMGELNMVLNGVEFRTRHNDYRLRKPAQHSKNYNAMENIVYPKVPWAVTSKKTVQEQIVEMREWFKGMLFYIFVLTYQSKLEGVSARICLISPLLSKK